ncbi:MAG: NADH-quinone oxidoreductase subunit L [Phycisphaeraceae bacterium]|nr:NADH-quinone oxidoreductase subunit L [Phycisphaeraceae bacterium]
MDQIKWLIVTATLLPLLSSAAVIFLGKRVFGRATGWLATAVMAGSFGCAVAALWAWMAAGHPTIVWTVPWIPLNANGSWLYLGVLIDSLGIEMVVMVTLISTLVHLYSIGYMAGDSRFERFFSYLSLFTFAMLSIVTANSIVQLFVGWELVGLTSYLLIGFWFEKRGPQLACKKAFVMNRIGDTGFLIGFGILFYKLGGQLLLPAADGGMFVAIRQLIEAQGYSITNPPLWLTIAGIGLFCGAIGKSAQFPLHTWLPDAMEGPTPVSSIVHSATMVAAGVYLTGRIYPILTPQAHLFVATIGLVTLVMAAGMALVMTDIKRVLAYSTLSQLGYMVLGMGVGAYSFAIFHLITHAFFKCCLFQCAGSVIHAAHHEQDMKHYGGLIRKLPVTALCYGLCMLAIAGASIPYTTWGLSGFYSKDGIVAGAVNYGSALSALGTWANVFWIAPLAVAYVTPFYMARSFALTFLGRPRAQHLFDHAHEAPLTMLASQIVLATMAVVSGWWMWQNLAVESEEWFHSAGVSWVQSAAAIEAHHGHAMHRVHEALLQGWGWLASLGLGLLVYSFGMKISSQVVRLPLIHTLYTWAKNKYYFDELYDGVAVNIGKALAALAGGFDKHLIDGLVNFAGRAGRDTAHGVGRFDLAVVDGAVDGAAALAQDGGRWLRTSQSGRVRGYVLLMFVGLIAGTLALIFVALR